MSRTFRHIEKVKFRQWWDRILAQGYARWSQRTRDELWERDKIGQEKWEHFHQDEKREANRRDRHTMKNSLRHGGTYWYYRRKHGDGWWD